MFNQMTIKLKLTILTVLTAVGFMILIGISQKSIHTMHDMGIANGIFFG